MSNLVEHAKRELEFANVEEDVRPSLIAAVEAFASYGHSGGSAAVARMILFQLLGFEPLGGLTDNPDEWMNVSGFYDTRQAVWQNCRHSSAFSLDGGKTYYLLDEERRWIPRGLRYYLRGRNVFLVFPKHTSQKWTD